MGLDNFWEMPEGKPCLKFDPPLSLCGGMFSDHGEGSFRGKVYNGFVEDMTGYSLYADELSNTAIKEIAAALEKVAANDHLEDYGLTEEEVADLVRMFQEYAKAGATLTAWY